MTLPTTCPGCGASLTGEGAVSIDFPGVEWCYFTCCLDSDGGPVVPDELRRHLPDDNLSHLSCAGCGEWLQEL